MRYLLCLGLLALAVPSQAQTATYTKEVAFSSGTVFTVNVASQTPVDVSSITANGTLYGAYNIEVYNPAASTNTINCGFAANVSTVATSNYYGREVPAGSGMVFSILLQKIRLFCLTQNATGNTRVTVTQLR